MVTQNSQPITEAYTLNQIDTALIPSGNRSDGAANAWAAIWKFQIPAGLGFVLGPNDQFSAYIEDGSAEVGNNTCRVRISIADTSESDSRVIFGPVPYVAIKEFQDRRKTARLNISSPVQIFEEQFLIIEVYDDGTIDESDSAFLLEMHRTRQGLG